MLVGHSTNAAVIFNEEVAATILSVNYFQLAHETLSETLPIATNNVIIPYYTKSVLREIPISRLEN